MASLYQRSNGTYYAQFYDSKRDPKRKRFSLKTKNKRPARRKLTELEDAYTEGRFNPWDTTSRRSDPFNYDRTIANKKTTVGEVIERFICSKQKQGRAERTINTYKGVWRRFANRVGGSTELSAVTAPNVEAFCHDRSVSDATRHKRWRHVRAVLNWAEDNAFLSSSPTEEVDPPPKADNLPTPVRKDDLPRICAALAEIYREKRRNGHCRPLEIVWSIPVFRWAFYTGMRATEIGHLKWKDVDLERGIIRIEEQKNRKAQTIPLIGKAHEVLRHTPSPRKSEMYVFRTPSGPLRNRNPESFGQSASHHFCEARRQSDIDRKLTFHDLRAGFGTALAESGKSAHVIRKAMRHADLTMALRYVRVSRSRLRDEMDDAFQT